MIVYDDLDVLAANARFLRVSGYEVIVSNRASMALAHIKDEDLDAVVTDLRMPEMDGLQLARQARVIKPLIPIVFIFCFRVSS